MPKAIKVDDDLEVTPDDEPAETKVPKVKKVLRTVRDYFKDEDLENPTKLHILAGLNKSPSIQGRSIRVQHVYAGTVDPVTKAHRRKKNKAARKARRTHRLASKR